VSDLSLPDYWLTLPPLFLDAAGRAACDVLLQHAIARGPDLWIDYTLPIPKWQFLNTIVQQHGLALHGSGNPEISRFEPRQPHDLEAFGAQNAVYAAADGVWPMYFAIVDRAKSPSIVNACIYVESPDGQLREPHYLFSISRQAVDRQPYHDGTVYLLPRASFVRQLPIQFGDWRVHTAQLASLEPVIPLAKLAVTPEDFPFLAQMRVHDDDRLAEYAAAMNQGLPWPE
jgi:hypothetical protein